LITKLNKIFISLGITIGLLGLSYLWKCFLETYHDIIIAALIPIVILIFFGMVYFVLDYIFGKKEENFYDEE
jgi:uncharacterized protein YacL